jgi:hypothetical protein
MPLEIIAPLPPSWAEHGISVRQDRASGTDES